MAIKRYAPGLYADDNDGEASAHLEMHRNLEWALSKTTNVVNFHTEPNKALAAVQHEDSAAAIDELLADDLVGIQRRLAAQAIATDQVFHSLSCMASVLLAKGDRNQAAMPMMKTALRAQENSRKTLVALAEIKRPKKGATFVKQQNNAVIVSPEQPMENPQTNQLGEPHHGRVDFGATGKGETKGNELEAVDVQHRAAN
jgi:hypothetical protein